MPSFGGQNSKTAKAAEARNFKTALLLSRLEADAAETDSSCTKDQLRPSSRRSISLALGRALREEIDSRCKKRFKPRIPESDIIEVGTFGGHWSEDGRLVDVQDRKRNEIFNAINTALNNQIGRVVGVSYNPTFILKNKQPGGGHGGTIVARSCDLECICKFRIRNSWGLEKNGKKVCEYFEERYARDCKDGMVWLTAEEIKSHVSSAVYLK